MLIVQVVNYCLASLQPFILPRLDGIAKRKLISQFSDNLRIPTPLLTFCHSLKLYISFVGVNPNVLCKFVSTFVWLPDNGLLCHVQRQTE